MRSKPLHQILWTVGAVVLLLGLDRAATAAVIAYWQFEPGNLLADSSGNGHTLTTLSGSVSSSANTDTGVAPVPAARRSMDRPDYKRQVR